MRIEKVIIKNKKPLLTNTMPQYVKYIRVRIEDVEAKGEGEGAERSPWYVRKTRCETRRCKYESNNDYMQI